MLNVYLVVCVKKCSFALNLCVRKCKLSMLSCVEKCNDLTVSCVRKCNYSSDTSRMEMDFLVQREGALLPIEVKGGTSIKATSLHNYLKVHPDISAIRYSMLPYRQQENVTNMPLYGVFLHT